MLGNIGTSLLRPGSAPTAGSSPNVTGTNIGSYASPAAPAVNPNFGLKPGAALQGAPGKESVGSLSMNTQPPPTAASVHSSGLPNQPPSGINPQLWSSILQHLQQTNFGKSAAPQQQQQPGRWAPLPSMMNTQPANRPGGGSFIGAF